MAVEWNSYLEGARKRRAKIISLHKSGVSVPKLAAKFGVSQPRIHQIIGKNGKRRG